MHKVLEQFYLSMLDYSGLRYDEVIKNKDERLGEFTVSDKHIALPYLSNLKSPQNRHIFHPLNESFVKPENPVFNLYKKRLVCEINFKLVNMFTVLAHISNSIELQSKIKDIHLSELISEFKDVDMVFIENMLKMVKSSKEKHEESFVIDLFLKKNGEIDNVPYSATGKVNFILYNEVKKSMEDPNKEYRVFGCKVRKKDLNILYTMFQVIFPGIDDKTVYVEKTDNKVFRYLNVLLSTAYLITNRMNHISALLASVKDDTIDKDDLSFNHDWTKYIDELYTLTSQIRMIPNQTDISITDHSIGHLKANENLIVDNTGQMQQSPQYPSGGVNVPANSIPQIVQQPMQQLMQQPMAQPMQPSGPVDPLDVLKNISSNPQYGYQPPPVYQQPQMMQQPVFTPSWMQRELQQQQPMQPQMYPNQMQPQMMPQQILQQPIYQQPMYPNQMQPQMVPQQMMQQPMYQQPMYPNQMQPQMYQQPSALSPHVIGRAGFN